VPERASRENGGERHATPAEAESQAQRLLEKLLAAVDHTRPVAIYTHDQPDPDSIASAYALQHLLARRVEVDANIVFGGTIGRATNRAMVELLGIRMHPIAGIKFEAYGTHCMIDTQPETGNHSIPEDLSIAIAIDHHPPRPSARQATFTAVRTEYGATSTMMFYYLKAAGLDLPTKLATALLIGIKSDTRGLEREASDADLHAYLEIFPRADLTLMARIENPRIPQRYFEAFHEALEVSALYDGLVVADMGEVENPDMVAEMADFFIPLDGADYALVMGRSKGRLYLSLRTRSDEHDAGATIARAVGEMGTAGGHGKMAGAQISLEGADAGVGDEVRRRFLTELGIDPDTEPRALIRRQAPAAGADR
jgi:nanoRNase/pAp phosphatase (c-di-AMP/oligoRNAs hydrolase)